MPLLYVQLVRTGFYVRVLRTGKRGGRSGPVYIVYIYYTYKLYSRVVRLGWVRAAYTGCTLSFLENNAGIYCIYIIYVQVVRKRVYIARPVRRGSAEKCVRYILYIYIIYTSCTYKCTPRIPFCVMRYAHT